MAGGLGSALLLAIFVSAIGTGILYPTSPFYVRSLGASSLDLGLLVAGVALVQFLFSPLWGGLSDRVGRKPLLLLGFAAYSATALLVGLSRSLWLVFGVRFVGGAFSAASLPAALAYVADTTPAGQRGGGMGTIIAVLGIGLLLGAALGGLIPTANAVLAYYAAAAVLLAATAIVALWLPESHQRGPSQTAGRTISLRWLWRGLAGPQAVPLLLMLLFANVLRGLEAIFAYWMQDRFGYGTGEVALALATIGMVIEPGAGGRNGALDRTGRRGKGRAY